MQDLENGVVASGAACNYGCGWHESVSEPKQVCAKCGWDISLQPQYRDIYGDIVCEDCFNEYFGKED